MEKKTSKKAGNKALNKVFVSRSKPASKKAKAKDRFPLPTEVIDKW